jgi:class 3 adenylate cyclase
MPRTRYVPVGDLQVAYQVWGDGPVDLAIVWGTMSHVEVMWEDPKLARLYERLGRAVRVIQFDRIGTGLSDRADRLPTLEDRMDNLLAVLDAVGCERVALLGESEGGPTSILFAAAHPERVSHLVLYGPLVRFLYSDDFPAGTLREVAEMFVEMGVENWGDPEGFRVLMPDAEAARLEWMARFARMASSPKAFRDVLLANFEIDIRPALPAVNVPTLVLHKADDVMVVADQGRYAAEHIPGARFVELRGASHYIADDDADRLADLVLEFVTGTTPAEEDDRVLASVLFTDIVASTEQAVRLGDRRWRELLDDHDRITRETIERHRGRVVKTTGDGALAIFDGPARAVRAGGMIVAGVRRLGIDVRAGVHTGEVELRDTDVGGVGVHIGARVAALADAGQVLVSRTVVDLVVGSQLEFTDAGTHALKGVPGTWSLFSLNPSSSA